ncbi:hypothetical protein [Archangium sp.]|uniref:hypothetical protein n=1 Tax=Archangium sp. TaxID=1872627 RepID=UPI003899F61C
MHNNDWNKRDNLTLRLYSPANPLDCGQAGLDEVLDFVESLDAQLRPDIVYLSRRRKYSRQIVHERLDERRLGNHVGIHLLRSRAPDEYLVLSFDDQRIEDTRSDLDLLIRPFAFLREAGRVEERAQLIVSLVRAFARRFPISYGLAHSSTDFHLGSDPHRTNHKPPKRVYEAYWLNVYGPRMVEELGRERVLSTPAAHLEELPGGAVLWLSRPTPVDFDSEEARVAQARALVHLRPELKLEETLATLRERSRVFVPVPVEFEPDVADILWWTVEGGGLEKKRENVERFNRYRPPPVTEWLPASQAPAPDVDDVNKEIDLYEKVFIKSLITKFRKEVPMIVKRPMEALPRLDLHLWHSGWGRPVTPDGWPTDADKEPLIAYLGAWLGLQLVHRLGGRWVPRRKREETAVVIGDRAWLPFLRARHALQGREAPLDYSCTQLFRVAQRLAVEHHH